MNNDDATHLLVILLAVAIFGIVVLGYAEVENEPFLGAIGKGLSNIGKGAGRMFGRSGKTMVPKTFGQTALTPLTGVRSPISSGFRNTTKWAGNAIKNDPLNAISILTTIPFLAMMFVPAGGGEYAEEEGGSGGPSAAGSMSSVAVVVFGLFCCCMCMSMMMAMSSSS